MMVMVVDFKSRTVTTSAGESIGYEMLVFVMGCGVIWFFEVIGGMLLGVYYVWNNVDGFVFVEVMDKVMKAVVVGGGYVGLEVAVLCVMCGLKLEVVMMELYVMVRFWNVDIV